MWTSQLKDVSVRPENRVRCNSVIAQHLNRSHSLTLTSWLNQSQPFSLSPTNNDATAVTPKPSAPANNERVSTLKAIKDQLKDRLDSERQKQLDAVKQLEYLGEAHPDTGDLSEEVTTRGNKIMVLSQKLTRTEHALGTLQKAANEYEVSAQKVRDVRSRSKSSVGFSHKETKSIRQELDAATAMMSAACQRVEQIESITDTLINQLSDTENELADLQNLRVSDLAKIEKLAHERDCLAMQLAASDSSSAELKKKQDELNAKLDEAKAAAKQFASDLDLAGKAMEAREMALTKECDELKKSLEESLSSQKALKDELVDAERRASEGTPKGKGAKEVLPLALKKLKGAQEELLSVSEEKARAIKDLEYAKQLAAAREDTLRSQVLEKDATLELAMKSAAAAAKDAADKQQAINQLRVEIAEITEAKAELEYDIADAKVRADGLAQEVALKQAQIDEAKATVEGLKRQHNASKAAALEKEILLKTQLEEEIARISAVEEKSTTLEKEYATLLAAKHDLEKSNAVNVAAVTAMKADIAAHENAAAELQEKLSRMHSEGIAAGEELAKVQRDLDKSTEQVKSLSYDLAAMQAAKNEVSGLLEAKEAEIIALSKDYAAKSIDLKAIVKSRDEKIAALESESAARQALVDNMASEMDSLVADQNAAETASREAITALTIELDASKAKLAALQARYAELEETSQAQLERVEEELDALKQQIDESAELRKALEVSLAEEKKARSLETGRLTEQVEALERNKDSLLRSLEGLEEQLSLKEDEVLVAKHQGTPKGEGAKVILQRSFLKIKDMQATIKDLQMASDGKDGEIVALKAENDKIPALLADTAKLQSEVDALSQQHAAKAADLEASQVRVARLERDLALASDKLESERVAADVIHADMAAVIDSLKAEVGTLSVDKAQAEQALAESAAAGDALQASLDESRRVLATLTNKDEGTTKVMKLAFVKVKKLENDLKLQQEKTAAFSSKLKDADESHADTQRKLETVIELHNAKVAEHTEATAALEANVSRLRGELLDEVAKVQALRADLDAALIENEKLWTENTMLKSTIDSMDTTVDTLQQQLAEERGALQRVEAAKESILAEMAHKISEVTKQKEIAESAWGQAAEEAAAATKDLDVAKSQLGAFERAANVKESTIASQKKTICDLERQAKALQSGVDDSKRELSQRDAELASLRHGKEQVERELAQNVQVRRKSSLGTRFLSLEFVLSSTCWHARNSRQLCRQHLQALKEALDKNARLDLAEAAAAKSAQILSETKARTALGHGLLVTTHIVYLMIGMLSILATGLLTLVN